MVPNALTIDLEDWYHGCCAAAEPVVPAEKRRVRQNTECLLDLLSECGVRATFFVLGSVVQEDPALIPMIAARGHEIASHGYSHTLIPLLGPELFRDEVRRTAQVIKRQAGYLPLGFRAPQWSLGPDTPWALEILRQEGCRYDSSYNPLPFIGNRRGPRTPFAIETGAGPILELPPMVTPSPIGNLPSGGGLGLQVFPAGADPRHRGKPQRRRETGAAVPASAGDGGRRAEAAAEPAALLHRLRAEDCCRPQAQGAVASIPVSNPQGDVERMGICLIIPAYNAEKTISPVAREALGTGLPVLVVDDGSRDATATLLHGLPLSVISHPHNAGKGEALRTGFAWALAQGFEGAVTLDADGQHEVGAVPYLLESARSAGFDILIASRFSQFEEMAGLRSSWNRFGVWCMRKRTGFEISDSQSGFRYYSARLLRQLTLQSTGYELEMEILLKAWRGGFVIGSLPIAARVADGRPTSHYRPVRDTWNICITFLRYM